MQWRRASAAEVTPESPPACQTDDLGAALDTIATVLRAFGSSAFDIHEVKARATQATCERLARTVLLGRTRSEGALPGERIDRDFPGVRRFFVQHRTHEKSYVARSRMNLRAAVNTFARCLSLTVAEDRLS